jgi:hypothetical protein
VLRVLTGRSAILQSAEDAPPHSSRLLGAVSLLLHAAIVLGAPRRKRPQGCGLCPYAARRDQPPVR